MLWRVHKDGIMRERGGGGELSKSSGISCKFHLLRLIKYTAVGVKLLRICGCLFQLFHSRPTYVLFLFFSSFLFLRAIVLLIQTEYYSYCSSLLSHASRYISQAGKLNLARGGRERERERVTIRVVFEDFFSSSSSSSPLVD